MRRRRVYANNALSINASFVVGARSTAISYPWLSWRNDIAPDVRQQLETTNSMTHQDSFPRP
jgi:hypothetical protein